MKRFKNIKDILERIAKKTGLDEKLKEAKILEVWNKEVGEKISNHTLPEKLVKGKLFVKVDSNVWMNQLTFLKKDIITKLNKAIGENLIKDIYFRCSSLTFLSRAEYLNSFGTKTCSNLLCALR